MPKSRANSPTLLRTAAVWERYTSDPKRGGTTCFMCTENGVIVARFRHWYVMENAYPYDAVADTHHILIPNDHVAHENELPEAAQRDLKAILEQFNGSGEYDCVMRNFTAAQSHPSHLHFHLLRWKRVVQ